MMCVKKMDGVQRSLIFHYCPKGHGYKRIHTKLVTTHGLNAHTEDSANYWVREYDAGRRDPTEAPRTGSLLTLQKQYRKA
jgi:hypothetical protein